MTTQYYNNLFYGFSFHGELNEILEDLETILRQKDANFPKGALHNRNIWEVNDIIDFRDLGDGVRLRCTLGWFGELPAFHISTGISRVAYVRRGGSSWISFDIDGTDTAMWEARLKDFCLREGISDPPHSYFNLTIDAGDGTSLDLGGDFFYGIVMFKSVFEETECFRRNLDLTDVPELVEIGRQAKLPEFNPIFTKYATASQKSWEIYPQLHPKSTQQTQLSDFIPQISRSSLDRHVRFDEAEAENNFNDMKEQFYNNLPKFEHRLTRKLDNLLSIGHITGYYDSTYDFIYFGISPYPFIDTSAWKQVLHAKCDELGIPFQTPDFHIIPEVAGG